MKLVLFDQVPREGQRGTDVLFGEVIGKPKIRAEWASPRVCQPRRHGVAFAEGAGKVDPAAVCQAAACALTGAELLVMAELSLLANSSMTS